MPRHRAATEGGFGRDVRVSVKLSEESFDREQAERKHQRLIAIISGTEIAFLEGVGEGELRDFLAVAENSEFRFAGEDFAPAQQTALPASEGCAVVAQHRFDVPT